MKAYQAKQRVYAAQWTGENIEEMKDLLLDVVESNQWDGPEIYSEYIEPYFLTSLNRAGGGYNMLTFYAGADMEVDPGQWIVVYEDNEVEIMDDAQFNKMFEEAKK